MARTDTTKDARRIQIRAYQSMAPQARVDLALEMSYEARRITMAGIRRRYPGWSEAQVHRAMLVCMYGADLVDRAWPDES